MAPVIIFNLDTLHCDALALMSGAEKLLHIPLKDFHLFDVEKLQKNLENILQHWNVRLNVQRNSHCAKLQMKDVLEQLWLKVVQPIIKALDYSVCHF